jgi:hypothetical protein
MSVCVENKWSVLVKNIIESSLTINYSQLCLSFTLNMLLANKVDKTEFNLILRANGPVPNLIKLLVA